VLSQVQDDRIWKDIKCFVEIYENKFHFRPGGAVLPGAPFLSTVGLSSDCFFVTIDYG
jgi:hypothetical protein